MQPKADMVPKECGFNQSETASYLCARAKSDVFDARLPWQGMMNLYTNAVFVITQTQFATQTQVT